MELVWIAASPSFWFPDPVSAVNSLPSSVRLQRQTAMIMKLAKSTWASSRLMAIGTRSQHLRCDIRLQETMSPTLRPIIGSASAPRAIATHQKISHFKSVGFKINQICKNKNYIPEYFHRNK